MSKIQSDNKINAIGKYIIVRKIEKEQGIILSNVGNNTNAAEGIVISVGTDEAIKNVKVGDKIIFALYNAKNLRYVCNFESNDFFIKIEDIIGVSHGSNNTK